MKLTFPPFDGRSRRSIPVTDEDTGKKVGHIRSRGVGRHPSGGIFVKLFDGKYRYEANRFEECLGFVKGVETVLCHMVATND